MQIKFDDLKKLVNNLDYRLNGYGSSNEKDLIVDISVTEENPGEGKMVAALIIKGTSHPNPRIGDAETDYVGEVYEASEDQPPKIVSVKVEKLI